MSRTIANRYARAWMRQVVEEKTLEQALNDAQAIQEVLEASRDLTLFLRSPIHSKEVKQQVLDAVFGGKIHATSERVIRMLVTKGRESKLAEIADAFIAMYRDAAGILDVHVSTAYPLEEAVLTQLQKVLGERTGKTISTTVQVDQRLIGGMSVRIGDHVTDGTVKHKLEQLKEQFAA